MDNWLIQVIDVLTAITLLGGIWLKGIRPMMVAIGEILDYKERLDQIERKLEHIERKINDG